MSVNRNSLKALLFLSLLFCPLIVGEENAEDENVEIKEETDVLVLTNENFHRTIEENVILLVEFYAPWCGHCKSLEPEYNKAAAELKKDGLKIGKVDATIEEDISKEFDVSGFPTLILFKDGKRDEDYNGGRIASDIVNFMKERADKNYKKPLPAVKVLTSANFTTFVDKHKLSLVEFYAPWCGHCKQLAPKYEEAAKDLKPEQIFLAKVDATEEKDIALKYNVEGFPTLFVFRHGRAFPFKGGRERGSMVSYMRKEAETPSSLVETVQEAKNQLPRDDLAVIGYFDSENTLYNTYIDVANKMRGECFFVHTFDSDVAKKLNIPSNRISVLIPNVLQSKFENNVISYKEDDVDEDSLWTWLKRNLRSLVGQRKINNVETRYDTRPLLVVFYDVNFSHQHTKATQITRSKVLEVAAKNLDITFAISNEEEFADELRSLGLDDSGNDVNIALFTDKHRYRLEPEEDFDTDVLDDFVREYKRGHLVPYLRSQKTPKRQEGPVRILVASTFEKEVLSGQSDVLVEFYAPWCGHCKKLEPVYKKVAKQLAKFYPKLVVAKIDATTNDVHTDFKVEGFPVIYLVKKEEPLKPLRFEGERTVEGIKAFIIEHLSSILEKEEL